MKFFFLGETVIYLSILYRNQLKTIDKNVNSGNDLIANAVIVKESNIKRINNQLLNESIINN